jgi:TnpA family transposase
MGRYNQTVAEIDTALQEDRNRKIELGALGFVVNMVVLWNTWYMSHYTIAQILGNSSELLHCSL